MEHVTEVLGGVIVQSIVQSLAVLIGGILLARFVNQHLRSGSQERQARLLLRRLVTGVLLTVSIAWSLSLAGVGATVLLGTAGFLTIAVGFAAQTSVSNLISGAFLMAERPFKVRDIIEVEGITGEVIVIDLMSVKLRTFDNLLVRIPNETMLKANLTNITHFAIRRYDLKIHIGYKEDMQRVRQVLMDVAEANPLCLKEPAATVIFLGFGDSAVDLQFSVWAKRESFLDLRNSVAEEVNQAFGAACIDIPFPHRAIVGQLPPTT